MQEVSKIHIGFSGDGPQLTRTAMGCRSRECARLEHPVFSGFSWQGARGFTKDCFFFSTRNWPVISFALFRILLSFPKVFTYAWHGDISHIGLFRLFAVELDAQPQYYNPPPLFIQLAYWISLLTTLHARTHSTHR